MATFMREGMTEPMDVEDAKTASLAGKLYSDAVEEAQELQHSAGGATVGLYLRKKWQQVLSKHMSYIGYTLLCHAGILLKFGHCLSA